MRRTCALMGVAASLAVVGSAMAQPPHNPLDDAAPPNCEPDLSSLSVNGGPVRCYVPDAADATAAWAATIQPMGWVEADRGSDGSSIMYTRHAIQPPNFTARRLWIRYEYQFTRPPPNSSYKSLVELREVDCRQARTRLIQQTVYPRNNMGGDGRVVTGDIAWEYGTPGTFAEDIIRIVC